MHHITRSIRLLVWYCDFFFSSVVTRCELCLHFENSVPPSAGHPLSIGTPVYRENFICMSRKVKVQLLLLQAPHLLSHWEREIEIESERLRERERLGEIERERLRDWLTFSVLSELPLQSSRLSDDHATYIDKGTVMWLIINTYSVHNTPQYLIGKCSKYLVDCADMAS